MGFADEIADYEPYRRKGHIEQALEQWPERDATRLRELLHDMTYTSAAIARASQSMEPSFSSSAVQNWRRIHGIRK